MANHITQWKPQVTINGQTTVFDNYAEVKRNMKLLLDRSISESKGLRYNAEVTVSRSRRGEWGEWFEYWGYNAERKPLIKKQGWQ
ncbi:MAG: hypothetical protein WC333_02105 [Dehalococcoidia bacterium]